MKYFKKNVLQAAVNKEYSHSLDFRVNFPQSENGVSASSAVCLLLVDTGIIVLVLARWC